MFNKILVPLDGSRFSLHALRYAEDISKHYKAHLFLLRVVKPLIPILSAGAPSIGMESPIPSQIAVEDVIRFDRLNLKRAEKFMEKKLKEVTAMGIKASSHIATGDPYESIMKLCKKEKINLVVMTTHGESGLKRAIMGSVADKVVRDPRVPVLVIRPAGKK
ncbi:MAG: universal stress protein [Spirochaetes bacterium]|nr:universal stress protein [Spirochaetota bacterium]